MSGHKVAWKWWRKVSHPAHGAVRWRRGRRAKPCRSSVQEKGQVPGAGVTRSGWRGSQHWDSTERELGDQADMMSPSPTGEAGPCPRASLSKWMQSVLRSTARPRHWGSSRRVTFGSPLHPSHSASVQAAGSEWCPKRRAARQRLFIVCLWTSHRAAPWALGPPSLTRTKPGPPPQGWVIQQQLSVDESCSR